MQTKDDNVLKINFIETILSTIFLTLKASEFDIKLIFFPLFSSSEIFHKL